MSPQLIPLSQLILSLTWPADPAMTYLIQSSTDLVEWTTLPYVVSGSDAVESFTWSAEPGSTFLRLKFDANGDSNDNSLPDLWEWQTFGYLDVDPQADPDSDGDSNYLEWLQGTAPLDFFNGERPVLRIATGREWLVPAGQVSAETIALRLEHANGDPWPDAPVQLQAISGRDAILVLGNEPQAAVPSMMVWTDHTGQIQPGLVAIHLLAPDVAGTHDSIELRAGGAGTTIGILALGSDFGQPPRDLRQWAASDGSTHYEWSGDPGEAVSFLLQQLEDTNAWGTVAEVAVQDLGAPDPVAGTYELVIE